jgi:hypothetical protein
LGLYENTYCIDHFERLATTSKRFYEIKTLPLSIEGVSLKTINSTLRGLEARGKRKLSKEALIAFPKEIVGTFAHLPRVFKKVDIDRLMGDKISRSMKWRYVRRMEKLGIVKHATKKYYRKLYDTISDWMEKDAIPRVRRMESLVEVETTAH